MYDNRNKQYQLTFESRDEYLYALIEADVMTTSIAANYLIEIYSQSERLKMRRIMIERKVPDVLPIAEIFRLVTDFTPEMRKTMVVFVEHDTIQNKELQFASLVGNNRGAMLAVHATVESGERWLRAVKVNFFADAEEC